MARGTTCAQYAALQEVAIYIVLTDNAVLDGQYQTSLHVPPTTGAIPMHHTHYHNDSQTWFSLDTCETCDAPIQAANAITTPDADKLRALGVQFVETLPAEGWYDNDTNMERCEFCPPIRYFDELDPCSLEIAETIAAHYDGAATTAHRWDAYGTRYVGRVDYHDIEEITLGLPASIEGAE